jgi:hypothetical protein
VRRLLEALFVTLGVLAWAGCQQTQEGEQKPDTQVIKEKETVVQPPSAGAAGADVKMNVGADSGGASAEVQVHGDSQ